MRVVGLDPGLNATGLALYSAGVWSTRTIRVKDEGPQFLAKRVRSIVDEVCSFVVDPVDILVIERPQVYDRSRSKGDPNDLIPLALIGGGVLALVNATLVLLPLPAQWKGQVPKHIHHKRLKKHLPPTHTSADARDAVGLALHGVQYAVAQERLRDYRRAGEVPGDAQDYGGDP